MRLIDADALKEQFGTKDGAFVVGHSVRRLLLADCMIDDMPTIDAVPVVRCKDCKTYSRGTCWIMRGKMNPEDFCSYGERRSDD